MKLTRRKHKWYCLGCKISGTGSSRAFDRKDYVRGRAPDDQIHGIWNSIKRRLAARTSTLMNAGYPIRKDVN